MADVTMPQLGETVTEGTITKWFKKVGDKIDEDEVLFEVSTEKVDSEVPSPASGYLAEILVQEGETVDVGAKLAVISDQLAGEGQAGDGESDEAADAGEAGEAEAEDEAEGAARAQEEAGDGHDEGEEDWSGAEEEARAAEGGDGGGARTRERAEHKDQKDRKGDGRRPAEAEGDGERAGAREPSGQERAGAGGGAKLLSPVVRRLIAEHDLDASQIQGTGTGGRITREDVLALIDTGGGRGRSQPQEGRRAPAPAEEAEEARRPAARAPAREGAAAARTEEGADVERVPFTNIRRRTAEHMIRSQATSAHVLTSIEVDFENVERVRRAAREEFKQKEGFSLTYLPFVSRAVVDAIEEFPHVNASVGDDELLVHRRVHLGFAVDLNFEGLIVPVVHDADGKRLRAIARELADLASRARAKKLSADEISGGTFTITNPGPFGTLLTFPVISQPQVAILSTDGVRKRPVAVQLPDGSDGIAVHPVGNLALSFDHRAFDGAYASAFVARCRDILETRDWAQEL